MSGGGEGALPEGGSAWRDDVEDDATGRYATGDSPLRILFICTANRCRSPLAEVIAREQIHRREVDAVTASAGYMESGFEAASGSINAARKRGLDLSEHRSRELEPTMISWADVIIGMEPGHILDLSDLVPGAQKWALTLKELARLVTDPLVTDLTGRPAIGSPLSTQQIHHWVRQVGDRSLGSLLSGENTVADPIGRSDRAFRSTAKEIDALITIVFDAWFGR